VNLDEIVERSKESKYLSGAWKDVSLSLIFLSHHVHFKFSSKLISMEPEVNRWYRENPLFPFWTLPLILKRKEVV